MGKVAEVYGSLDLDSMFVKGASDAFSAAGYGTEDGSRVAKSMLKAAKSSGRGRLDDDDDEEDSALKSLFKDSPLSDFWRDNKWWIIPSLVGGGAFMLGDHLGKYGRRDRNALQNAWDVLSYRVRRAFGSGKDNLVNALSTSNIKLDQNSPAHGVKLK